MGWAVWAVIVFGLACVAGGYLAARFGPELYPSKPRAGVMDTPAPALAPLTAPFAPATPQAGGELSLSAEPATGEIASRMDALEAGRARVASAAASALTAAALVEASQTSRSFAGELQALAASAPSLDLRSLTADAERGAPSRMALAASFPDYAARAASAARAPGDGAGVLDRIGYALSRVVTLRGLAMCRARASTQCWPRPSSRSRMATSPPHWRRSRRCRRPARTPSGRGATAPNGALGSTATSPRSAPKP